MTAVKSLDGRELVAFVMEYAGCRHVDLAEAYFSREEELSIEVRNGEVENLKIARDEGLGIRVIHRKRQGFAFTSDLSREAVQNALDAALANARAADEDPCYVLPEPAAAYPDLELDDPRLREVTLEEKIEMVRQMEDSGRSFDHRVRLTEQASYEEVRYQTAIANSKGVLVSSGGSYCGCYVAFVAGEGGDQQTGFALSFKRRIAELDPAALGREAADKAVRMLGARRKPTKRLSVVLDPFVVASFLGMLSSALTAEAVQRGRSLFAGKMGEQVAAKGVTVIDDGALQDGILSAPCDGEGVPTRRTLLLDDGVLCSFLHNSYTAAKEGVSSTGNAVRGSFQSPPQLGSTNFYLEPGYPSPVQIIREMDEGLYVTEVMGMHTANPISGDFSLGVAGIWIEHGELTTPVRGMVIAGNILELLSRIDAVGSDLRFFGGKGAPTVRVGGLTVSGQ
ncbi:PmbA/TldD protein [Thermacetogenium phaeum DSM 12270]|uniref:PmbA/TldD protein n=1 Tax=Thermacetogenium phaeum (strain ATCC BAA-254 / DSM 26808 / PB) TaxID=1089553 RepID=K4LFS9_THEPS|nr:TldD/PmbA family protein [Thermacetogenium phaeum]AFV11856.1 PmbA/TldD protein [Thermacetogenium phaeum DSM 12270]